MTFPFSLQPLTEFFFLQDSDVHVTFEDQQKINKFARHNAKLQDLKDEVLQKKVFLAFCC